MPEASGGYNYASRDGATRETPGGADVVWLSETTFADMDEITKPYIQHQDKRRTHAQLTTRDVSFVKFSGI